jgi:hypothetical protein
MMTKINLDRKFGLFDDQRRPKGRVLSRLFRDHRSCADDEAQVLLFEASGTVNTADVVDADFTAPTGIVI